MFMSQTFLRLSDMDVLIFNTVPKQSENLVVDLLKKKKKKALLYTQLSSCSGQLHFLSFVALIGDPSVGEVLTTYRNDSNS